MKRTMSPEEEAEWEAQMRCLPKIHAVAEILTETPPTPVTRKRAYTVEDLWKKWAVFTSKYPNVRDGAEFLVWLEK